MTTPPDEKTLEDLNAATRPRKARGKWRIIIAVGVTLVLLVAGVLVALESYRQSKIDAAHDRFTNELNLARTRYQDVHDWPARYVSKLPPNCNHDALRKWIDHCHAIPATEGEVARRIDLMDDGEPVPTTDELQQYLADTAPLADEAKALLGYHHLGLLPQIDNGIPSFNFLDAHDAFKMLIRRTDAFRRIDDWNAAWRELDVTLRIIQKLDQPASLADMLVAFGAERTCHQKFADMAATHAPPDDILRHWKDQPGIRTGLEHEILEYELVYFVQLTLQFDPDDEEVWEYLSQQDSNTRFDYLSPKLDWDERKQKFSGESLILDAITDYVRRLRTVVENPAGRASDLGNDDPLLVSLAGIPKRLYELSLWRQGSALLCRILMEQKGGDINAAIRHAATAFPDYELFKDGAEIVIRLRYEEKLLSRLPDEDADGDEFYEYFEPVRLALRR